MLNFLIDFFFYLSKSNLQKKLNIANPNSIHFKLNNIAWSSQRMNKILIILGRLIYITVVRKILVLQEALKKYKAIRTINVDYDYDYDCWVHFSNI